MSRTEPSQRVILQRIRNRIIEHLETLSSIDAQLEYAAKVPYVYVPYELINGWEDWVDSARPADFSAPVFTGPECDAIERFHLEWDAAAEALPDDYPPLEEVLASSYWKSLQCAASSSLKVFKIRGRLPEDEEAAQHLAGPDA
jgi:hypothetical protein